MRHVKNNDFISGQYVWTGFDYIGEPTPYGWPARSSYFGIIDLAGFPHWNWTEGQDIDLWAYYNNADEVELFVNGKSQGVRSKGKDDFHVMWRVKYESGTVKAVSRKEGKTVAEQEIRTCADSSQPRPQYHSGRWQRLEFHYG